MHKWGQHHTGPIVGIITTGKSKNRSGSGNIERLFKELISCGRPKNIFTYYFYPRGINWKHRVIKGYSHDGRKWRSGIFPFPDIVYNRILYRNIEGSTEIKNILKRFQQDKDIHLFNSRFLEKWEVHKVISTNKETAHLVPDTELLTRETLGNMLKRHKEVLLKPRHSSRGQGIIKIIKLPRGHSAFSRAEWKTPRWIKAASFNALVRHLEVSRVFNKNYLIQECIELTRYNDRIFDLRSQFQKNGAGKWVLTGVGVRIAGKNRFVTHIPNGGTLASYDDIIPLFNDLTADESQSFDRQLKNIGLFIPKLLEESLQIELAVLSMDIGIDPRGKMLILEINSKPARFDEPHIRQRHHINLVDYFLYLTGKKYKRNDKQ